MIDGDVHKLNGRIDSLGTVRARVFARESTATITVNEAPLRPLLPEKPYTWDVAAWQQS